jgi:two-component system chemotaxis sensor kinase CheA
MPFTESEIQEMKELFIEDGYENLEHIQKQLEILEKDMTDNMAIIEYYRINHSFKGMAGTTGLVEFEKFFHKHESFIKAIQDKKIAVDKSIIDLLYEVLDAIDENLSLLKKNLPCNNKFEILIKKCDELISMSDGGEEAQNKSRIKQMFENSGLEEFNPDLMDYDDDSKKFYSITIILEDNIRLKLARLLVVIKKVVEFGDIAQSVPPLPDILAGKIENWINIIYQSRNDEEFISQQIKSCGEIKDVKIETISIEEVERILKTKKEENKKIQEEKEIETSTEVNSVKVNLNSLDKLVELYGELLISTKQLEKKLEEFDRPDINEILFQVQQYLFDLQDVVSKMQLVSISSVFRIFPRMVRNLGRQSKKPLNFSIKDHDVKVDRKILADIGDIVNHLLRNAIDHGIESTKERKKAKKPESATVSLETKIQNNLLVLEVKDDGGGINTEKIKRKAVEKEMFTQNALDGMTRDQINEFIFLPEFSTADKVTNISGRGLGLNIVKEKVTALGGSIKLETEISIGTTFRVSLPISKLLIKAILIRSGNQIFSIALEDIERLYEVNKEDISVSDQTQYITMADTDEMITIHNLGELFNLGVKTDTSKEKTVKIVHVKKGDKSYGLVVDEFLKESEIVIKQIDDVKGEVQGISGAAILDDGKVSLIIDPFSVI